jgi:5S rRNA maturation endonuclease (ribonuclease M5)
MTTATDLNLVEQLVAINKDIEFVVGEIAELDAAIGAIQAKFAAAPGVTVTLAGDDGSLLSQIAATNARTVSQQSAAEARAELEGTLAGATAVRSEKSAALLELQRKRSGVQFLIDAQREGENLEALREELVQAALAFNILVDKWRAIPSSNYRKRNSNSVPATYSIEYLRIAAPEGNPCFLSIDFFGMKIPVKR